MTPQIVVWRVGTPVQTLTVTAIHKSVNGYHANRTKVLISYTVFCFVLLQKRSISTYTVAIILQRVYTQQYVYYCISYTLSVTDRDYTEFSRELIAPDQVLSTPHRTPQPELCSDVPTFRRSDVPRSLFMFTVQTLYNIYRYIYSRYIYSCTCIEQKN